MTTIIVVIPQSNHLFEYSGEIIIKEVEAANSEEFIKVILPQKTQLNDSYPNPFNPITNISYVLAEDTQINLSIYNIQGQLIQTLVENRMDSGSYSLSWDASMQSSGMYILRLETNQSILNQKLMVIK